MNQTIKLTHKNLYALGIREDINCTREQLQILGVSCPPKEGWLENLIGNEISVDVFRKLIQIRPVKEFRFKIKQKVKETKSIKKPQTEEEALIERLDLKIKKWKDKQIKKRRKWLMSKPKKSNIYPTLIKGCNRAKDWYGF